MSFYDTTPDPNTWSAAPPARQPSWDHPAPPSRSGTGSSISHPFVEPNAFAAQFEEIERATDNLVRSGKWFPGALQPAIGGGMAGPIRRDSLPPAQAPVSRGYEFGGGDPRMGGGGGGNGGNGGASSRHASMGEYETGRPGSAGLQGYYQGQRFPGGRQSEAEQMLQAKRRMAAQRERELRNYHQEQQYNRTVSGGKSDRSMSPNTMSEDDRRELIARQHRALYGDNASLYAGSDGSSASRPQSQDVRASNSGRGASPLAFDPYGVGQQASQGGDGGAVQMPPRDRASPVNTSNQQPSQQTQQQGYGLLSDQQASRPSTSSPGAGTESPQPGQPSQKSAAPTASAVAPIGTRPTAQQTQPPSNSAAAVGANKRATTPSALSYAFSATDGKDERSGSAASNPGSQPSQSATAAAATGVEKGLGGGWGSNSGVWGAAGGKGSLAVQPSVWG